MKIEVRTAQAPKAIGPYSQAVIANGLIYCSGQIPLVPETGEMVAGGIEDQTRLVFENLTAVIEAAGSSADHVLKCTVFLQDLNDFPTMNKIYGQFFKPPFPARSTVQVARLPRDAKIEIEAIVLVP